MLNTTENGVHNVRNFDIGNRSARIEVKNAVESVVGVALVRTVESEVRQIDRVSVPLAKITAY